MGARMLQDCLNMTGRTYPDGYGFALRYLSDALGLEQLQTLRHCAWYVCQERAEKGDHDAAKFVAAVAGGKPGWWWWAVEAAQLVHTAAMRGNHLAVLTMRSLGHPGF